jgi:hypothetical protein
LVHIALRLHSDASHGLAKVIQNSAGDYRATRECDVDLFHSFAIHQIDGLGWLR